MVNLIINHKENKIMKIQNIIYAVLIMSLLPISIQAGGGWPQPKGKAFIKLSEWWTSSNQHYTDAGLIDPNVTLGIYTTSLYAEYGITNRLTGIVYFPLFSRALINNTVSATTGEILNGGDAINGLGDTDISLKYGLTGSGSPISVSASVLFGIPIGNDLGGKDLNLQTGDGEFNQLFQIDAGSGFQLGSVSAYANVYAGFNNRTGGFSDEIRFGFEAGVAALDSKLWLIGRFNRLDSRENGTLGNTSSGTSIFSNNAEYSSVGVELSYKLTNKLGVSAGFATAVNGKIILAAPSYTVGVFVNL